MYPIFRRTVVGGRNQSTVNTHSRNFILDSALFWLKSLEVFVLLACSKIRWLEISLLINVLHWSNKRIEIITTNTCWRSCTTLTCMYLAQPIVSFGGPSFCCTSLKVRKSQKHFFLNFHCPKKERNIRQNFTLWS